MTNRPRNIDQFIEFALTTSYEDLPTDVTHATKRVILDTVGCTVAGLNTKLGSCLAQLKLRQGGKPESILFAAKTRLPAASISYVHAQAANAMDADETLLHRTHFACCIVLPVLALAEKLGVPGSEVIIATALGFDIAARVTLAMPLYDANADQVPITGYSASVFGTVVALARLLGLSRKQMENALGIAYASAPLQRLKFFENNVLMTKYAMYGEIAEAGVNAALLAELGFTGDSNVLEPERQFWRGLGAVSCDWEFMMRGLKARWFIEETSFKPYPVARQLNIPLDLLRKIMRESKLSMSDIDKVVVHLPSSKMFGKLAELPLPRSPIEAPFSPAYALAMAASGLPPGPKWHRSENLKDPDYCAFMNKIFIRPDKPEWRIAMIEQVRAEGTYRRIPTEVEVTSHGKVFTAYADYAKGDPWKPETRMSDDELRRKFHEFAYDRLEDNNIEKAMDEIYRIDKSADIRALVSCLD